MTYRSMNTKDVYAAMCAGYPLRLLRGGGVSAWGHGIPNTLETSWFWALYIDTAWALENMPLGRDAKFGLRRWTPRDNLRIPSKLAEAVLNTKFPHSVASRDVTEGMRTFADFAVAMSNDGDHPYTAAVVYVGEKPENIPWDGLVVRT